jgi:BCD family chlorophyll transporter-like MFS transporter
MTTRPFLGWPGILRLGLVQTALGAIVVLTTSAINRVMVVELSLAATLPGLLVGLHYAVQMLRPRLGHGSDVGGRRTPWIVGGVAVLALGGTLAAAATAVIDLGFFWGGVALATLAFLLIGLGVGAAGTSLLVLLAARVAPGRRAAAASIVWIMMIAGFVVTTAIAGRLLDPYSPERLLAVSAGVCAIALLVAAIAVWGVEGAAAAAAEREGPKLSFRDAIAEVWAESEARRFTVFVFVSMLGYAAQDLVLEPFAGQVFGLTLGQTTQLASVQHGGVLAGMIVVALAGSFLSARHPGLLRLLTIWGCVAAAGSVLVLAFGGLYGGSAFPLAAAYMAAGVANGVFAAAAIASMMQLAGGPEAKGTRREGVRMGLWGAAQAIAFGIGGLAGTVVVDLSRHVLDGAAAPYAVVFVLDALLFLAAAALAATIGASAAPRRATTFPAEGHAA